MYRLNSQSTSCMTSISENEMNIRNFSLCNVQHLNGMLNISLEIFPKKTHKLKKKIQNTWDTISRITILLLLFLKDLML